MDKKTNGYNYEVTMSPEEFEEANTGIFQQEWVENNPEKAYMINDGELGSYYNDLDWGYIRDVMCDCYVAYLSDNF